MSFDFGLGGEGGISVALYYIIKLLTSDTDRLLTHTILLLGRSEIAITHTSLATSVNTRQRRKQIRDLHVDQ